MPESEDGTPKPGHFLPGGSEEPAAGSRPLILKSRHPDGLGKARSVALDDAPVRRKARPIPTEPGTTSEYSGPPVAPLTGAPLPPLTGTRRIGGQRPTGWHKNPSRGVPQFSTEPPPVKPPRHYSSRVIAGLAALVLVMLTGATVAGFKLINSYDTRVDNPLSQPSVKRPQLPIPTLPDPTVTVTAPTVPDIVRLQKNELYKAGALSSVNCKEPAIKPTSAAAVLAYYRAVLPCLDRAWAPVVKAAGYDFQPVALVLQAKAGGSGCTRNIGSIFYCESELSISIDWQSDLASYREDPLGARMWMLDALATMYGHHVQHLTQMMTAELSREGWAKTKAERLEWNRRRQLQAGCLGGVFLGSNKKSLGLTGNKYKAWEEQAKLVGDDPGEHTEGSAKNNWLWTSAGFTSANPGSCNTFTAPAAKVS